MYFQLGMRHRSPNFLFSLQMFVKYPHAVVTYLPGVMYFYREYEQLWSLENLAGSLKRLRSRRQIVLVAAFLLLGGLFAYSIYRPDPEEKAALELKTEILSRDPEKITNEEREHFREAFDKLSPETRRKLVKEVMRGRLEEARKRTANLSQEEKQKIVDDMIQEVRKGFSNIDQSERERIKADMKSGEGKARMKDMLEFYYDEFTPEEKSLMDPLVNEILTNLDALK